MDREQLREAREVAEEELAFIKDTGKNPALWNGRRYYKQQLKLLDHIEALEGGVEKLLYLLQCYYWQEDDEELEAVNTLRRLIGWRDQLPKHLEVELQADEAEGRG